MHIRRVLALCLPERRFGVPLGVALLIAVMALPTYAQRNNDRNKPQQNSRPPQEQQDVETLVRFVDAHQLADPALPKPAMPPTPPNAAGAMTLPTPEAPAFQLSWDANHFIRGPGGVTYVPYTMKLDRTAFPAKGVAYHVRLVDQAQAQAFASWYASAAAAAAAPEQNQKTREAANAPRPTFGWNDVQFFDLPEGNTMQRALQVAPGKYVAYFVMKEKSAAPAGNNNRNNRDRNNNKDAVAAPPAKIGMLRHEIDVPDFTKAELTTSSLLLASSIEPLKEALKPGEQEANPYVFGPMRITPSADAKFSQAGTINLLFWIYGAQNSATGKPDVTVDYMFHQKQGGNEKYFNRTPQQAINATTLPPEFTADGGLVGDLGAVPAKVFPPADYRLEVKVTDKVSGKTVTQNMNFTVVP
jgi:hypothetical protein